MEQKAFLFTLVPIVAIIVVFGYLNIQQDKALNPVSESSSECQNIVYNGEDRIDLLFISSKEDAQHYSDYLFSIEPYKSYKDYFNVRVLEEEVQCEYYRDIAILCNNKEVQDVAKKCPHDYILVVKEDSKNIRSSSYGNVMSINKAHEDSVSIHEAGHAIAGFGEEYEGAKLPFGAKNCKSSCSGFSDYPIDECLQGCSDSNHYRSIPNGVMRTLATSNYGLYDIALLKEILDKNKPEDTTVTGNQILEEQTCDNQILQISVIQSEVQTDNVLQIGCAPDQGLAGEVCLGNVCNINTLFTDAQDITTQNIIEGETYINPDIPLTFYIEQNPSNPLVDITLNNQLIGTINTMEAGATACRL